MAKKTEEPIQVTEQAPEGERMVRIMLPKDNNENKGDLFVGVNMQDYRIPRGKPVDVPESVAKVIQNMMDVTNEAMEFEEANKNVKYN